MTFDESLMLKKVVSKLGSSLIVRVDAKQNCLVSDGPLQVALHVRHVPECDERQGNHGLRGGSMELCSMGGLVLVP